MDNWSKSVDQSKEEKLNLAIVEQITRIVEKIRLECFHVTATLDSTFTKLNSLSEINPNQSQVYTVLQQQLIAVVDDKIPSLFSALSQINEAQFNETVKKAKSNFVAFENQEKSRLYLLVQLVAEKTAFMSPQISHASKNKSETIHLKKVDPPTFTGDEIDYPDFFRKWNAIVGPANLPEEAEIDRLKGSCHIYTNHI